MSDATPGPDHRAEELTAPVLGIVEHTLEGVLSGSALGPYRKLLWQITGAFSGLLLAAVAGHVDLVTVLTAVAGGLGAIVVYRVPNAERGPWRVAKLIASALVAAVQALIVLIVGGVLLDAMTPQQWVSVVVAGLAAIGLVVTPNDPEPVDLRDVAGTPDVSSLPAASR